MSRQTEEFCMEDYGKKSTFASFLPGIAGVFGIPIWCYYVNRGQGVVSFGVDNKDHAIMEFYPAHTAYQNVKRTGFRTFIRKDGAYLEAFADEDVSHKMMIHMNALELQEENREQQLTTQVRYFVLPEEPLGALVRQVTVTNTDHAAHHIEILDGMPALIPYGVGMESMKNMAQTTKAWMQVEDVESRVPYYRVRVSMEDSAAVEKVEGGNFSMGCLEDGTPLMPIVDPEVIFAYDQSLGQAVAFREQGLKALLETEQNISNLLPCSFYGSERELQPGEGITIYELIGQVENKTILEGFLSHVIDGTYFNGKYERACALVDELCAGIETRTGNPKFDAYCKYTYMDNVLRGGYPIRLGNNKIFYAYSRKHGDLERDYNYFSMLPEFFSQGNGNFRDVNQNRRCDTFFASFVGRENIHTFYSLIQLDGYNPLSVEKLTYCLEERKAQMLVAEVPEQQKKKVLELVTRPFTPGKLYACLLEAVGEGRAEVLFYSMIDFADSMVNGNFGEGYWSDHWTYNLDLIEEYISVFPEKEREMLYEGDYTYFLSQVNINPRRRRYAVTPHGLRQYHALDEEHSRTTEEKLVRTDQGRGEIFYATLMEKLLLLCALKFAALDAYGMGVEMEGGKPGWYDALNGMPGMLGSSMAETYELARMLEYTIGALERYPGQVEVLSELGALMEELQEIDRSEKQNILQEQQVLEFWNRINDAKEAYRDKTYQGVSGEKKQYDTARMADILRGFQETVKRGIEKACGYGNGICPTYFTYRVTEYEETENGIWPLAFEVEQVPSFLEGPVRYLKLPVPTEQKKELYRNIRKSDLYDEKLSMYKVNASLQEASYELGRATAFTPGWLENESIWLHMEYKYLLELLRSGLYEEFAEDFHKAVIPFLDEDMYGRSTLENSSFLASSRNPNHRIHGKGFVARLSGSTIEFISMWKHMMFGKTPFALKNGSLSCSLTPVIPEYLLDENCRLEAKLLGTTQVVYQVPERRNYFPGNYEVISMKLYYQNGSEAEIAGAAAQEKLAEDIRAGRVERIEVYLR